MSRVDIFEQVRTGQLSPADGAEKLAKNRERDRRPTKPDWLPRPIYLVGIAILAFLIPRLVSRNS